MSALAVQGGIEQIVGQTVRNARQLINKDWTAKRKRNLRTMIRAYGQLMKAEDNHGLACKHAKSLVRSQDSHKTFDFIINRARSKALHPARDQRHAAA
jgi:hypothetical protein